MKVVAKQQVEKYKYLGSKLLTGNLKSEIEVKTITVMAKEALNKEKNLYSNRIVL